MIKIQRTTGKVKNLIFVHPDMNLGESILFPSIPNDFLVTRKFINWQVPRIKLYTTIDDAISGKYLGSIIEGMNLGVYQVLGVREENLIKPGLSDCPYGLEVEEWWYLVTLRCKLLGEIQVGEIKDKLTYHYGPRQTRATLYRWQWEEILKPWEKKK